MAALTQKMNDAIGLIESCIDVVDGAHMHLFLNEIMYAKPGWHRYHALAEDLRLCKAWCEGLISEARGGTLKEIDFLYRAVKICAKVASAIHANPHIELKTINNPLIAFSRFARTIEFPSYFTPQAAIFAVEPYRWAGTRTDRSLKLHYYAPDADRRRSARITIDGREFDGLLEEDAISMQLPADFKINPGLVNITIAIPTKDFWSFLRDDWTIRKATILFEEPDPFTFTIQQFGTPDYNFWGPTGTGDDEVVVYHHGDERHQSRMFVIDGKKRRAKSTSLGRGRTTTVELAEDWTFAKVNCAYKAFDELRWTDRQVYRDGEYTGSGWRLWTEGRFMKFEVFDL